MPIGAVNPDRTDGPSLKAITPMARRHTVASLAVRVAYLERKYINLVRHVRWDEQKEADDIMATQQELDQVIAQLPQTLAEALDAALRPVIDSINAKSAPLPVDFQPEIDQLNALSQSVATRVTTDLTPASTTGAAGGGTAGSAGAPAGAGGPADTTAASGATTDTATDSTGAPADATGQPAQPAQP